MKTNTMNIQRIVDAYIDAIDFTESEQLQDRLIEQVGHGDYEFAPEVRRIAEEEIRDFLSLCEQEGLDLSGLSEAQIGHDFWLTRNRHGAGFWDRGLGDLGTKLTKLAHTYGDVHVWVDSDSFVYID